MKEKQYCQCCLSQECYKNMFVEYLNGEKKENYAEMLLNTFNININSKCNTCVICETCIIKLRQAFDFKQLVLTAQVNIAKQLNNTNIDKQHIEDDLNGFDDRVSDRFTDSDFMWDNQKTQKGQVFVIKLESKDDEMEKNVPRKTAFRKISNTISAKSKTVLKTSVTEPHKKANKQNGTKTDKAKEKKVDKKYEPPPISQTELDARENSLKLIQNSNLCLFRSLKTKFGCFMCNSAFVDELALREHSVTHNIKMLDNKIRRWRGLSYKNADISNLKCNKCSTIVASLTELMSHLTERHDIIFSGNTIYLIPFRLADENQCTLCDKRFNSFLRLSIHMHTHYTNNICEICGLSFISRKSLRTHVQSMHKETTCPHCPAKFLTVSTKVAHLKKVHKVFNKKRYCNLCEKTFPYSYLLVKHKIEEHGAKKDKVNCIDCGKTFFNEVNLRIHVRSVHNRERNYPCEVCGTCFFTKRDLKRHEKTHNDVRSFSCSNCDGKFKSKDSWRRHMRRQHGHVFT